MNKPCIVMLALLGAGPGDPSKAGERTCVQCTMTTKEAAEKCSTKDQAGALLCLNDAFSLVAYLEDVGRLCRVKQPTTESLKADYLKVIQAFKHQAMKQPETLAVEVAHRALAKQYPCK